MSCLVSHIYKKGEGAAQGQVGLLSTDPDFKWVQLYGGAIY